MTSRPADRHATSTVRVALLGCGNVGSALAQLLLTRQDDIAARTGIRLELVAIAVSRELAAQDYASITGRFDPLAVAANTQQPVQASWEHVVANLGRLRGIGAPAVLDDGADEILYEVDFTFDHGHAHVQVDVDNNLQVEALLILAGPPTRIAAK